MDWLLKFGFWWFLLILFFIVLTHGQQASSIIKASADAGQKFTIALQGR